MSRLWSTLKSVVGGTAVKEVEPLVSQAAAAVSVNPPAAPGDGIFLNLSTVKPHVPLIKFRYFEVQLWIGLVSIILFAQERSCSHGAASSVSDSGVCSHSVTTSSTTSTCCHYWG